MLLQEQLSKAAANPSFQWRTDFSDLCVEVKGDGAPIYLSLTKDGTHTSPAPNGTPVSITLNATDADWAELMGSNPRPGLQSLSAMRRTGHLEVSGDHLSFYRHLLMLEQIFTHTRPRPGKPIAPAAEPRLEDVVGRYLHLELDGVPHRLYFEEAGQGIPLICLHTAGADGRQYRHILNDPEITKDYRVIVFDLPWHGKSSPPAGFEHQVYKLTTDSYMEVVMAVGAALNLENPVVMGCSIGGRAVLHLALRHGDDLRAVIGLQSALYAENKIDGEPEGLRPLHRPDIHAQETAAALMTGLIAPQSNSVDAWETLWHYMQGGPGIFMGDLNYYFTDGDMRNGLAEGIDTKKCPVHLLSGDYDTSATPEMGEAVAKLINATSFQVMHNMGHFPMSENPEEFRTYLLPVLAQIKAS